MKHAMQFGLIVSILAGSASGATLIVDNGHPQAADTNSGTREAPFRTISAAAARVQPGDEVLVRPGTYREVVTLTVSGREGAPIVFRSEEPRAAVICGSDAITEWQDEGAGVWSFANDALVRIPDYDKDPVLFGNGEWVYVDGFPLERVQTREQLLPGAFRQDFAAKRVYVAPPDGVPVSAVKVDYARRAGLIVAKAPLDDIHIVGFTLMHNADWFRGWPTLRISGQRWRVENNRVCWASYAGVLMDRSHGAVVRGNLIEWCGDGGIGGSYNAGMLVESNLVRYCNWRRINPNFEGGGSKWAWTIDSRLRGNEFYGNHGAGIWFDAANSGNVIEQNLTHDNSIWALFSEMNWDFIFRDNVSYNNGHGLCIAESCGIVAQRNIVFNNDTGIYMRGNHRRGTDNEGKGFAACAAGIRAIPGVCPLAADRWEAGYLKYWMGPQAFMINNNMIWENVVFDNKWYNYEEHRNYTKPTALDPFINNFSDHNIWYGPRAVAAFHSADGDYGGGLAGWQQASGRDAHSREFDPRTAGTNLPAWVEAKRALWDLGLRPWREVQDLQLGLVDSPMACEVRSRISRSASVTNVALKDPTIRAFAFDAGGRRAIGLWTTHPAERRNLRLKLGQPRLMVENGYLGQTERTLRNGVVDLVVTYIPTYLHGVGPEIVEAPAGGLSARAFNPIGEPIPVTATFVNDADTAVQTIAAFVASPGYRAEPAQISRQMEPRQTVDVPIRLLPDGALRKGVGQVRMDAHVGEARLVRVATFGVGESAGVIPPAPGRIEIDGNLDDWRKVVTTGLPAGVVVDTNQFANGDLAAWKGAADLGAKIYAAWTTQALYVAVVVTDDRVSPAPPGADPWAFDSVELFVDGRSFDMQWQPQPTEGCYQLGVSPAKDGLPVNVRGFGRTMPDARIATALTATGYVVEFSLPLTRRNFPAADWKVGRPIRMSVLLNDRDDAKALERKVCFGWAFSPGGSNFADTSGWKTLTLGAEPEQLP